MNRRNALIAMACMGVFPLRDDGSQSESSDRARTQTVAILRRVADKIESGELIVLGCDATATVTELEPLLGAKFKEFEWSGLRLLEVVTADAKKLRKKLNIAED